MDVCCEGMAQELDALRVRQRRVLVAVLTVNAVMFAVELVSGWLAHSAALTADSLDMLGDALIYAMSLYAIGRGPRWEAGLAFAKGGTMLLLGGGVLVQIVLMLVLGHHPHGGWMGGVGALALAANLTCLVLLTHHRHDDINLRSTWTCARNDVLANLGVLLAALGVGLTGTGWPDVLVGTAIAALVMGSSLRVLRDARIQWHGGTVAGLGHGHAHGHTHDHAHDALQEHGGAGEHHHSHGPASPTHTKQAAD
jgi:Co/Zn/Cd efflux system component